MVQTKLPHTFIIIPRFTSNIAYFITSDPWLKTGLIISKKKKIHTLEERSVTKECLKGYLSSGFQNCLKQSRLTQGKKRAVLFKNFWKRVHIPPLVQIGFVLFETFFEYGRHKILHCFSCTTVIQQVYIYIMLCVQPITI